MDLAIESNRFVKYPYNLNIINLQQSAQSEYDFIPTSPVPILPNNSPFGKLVSTLGEKGLSKVACLTPEPIEHLQNFYMNTLKELEVVFFFGI